MYFYNHHIGDFRSGTVNMNRLTRWIYRDMMDVYYDTEQPLPLDLELLCDMLGVEVEEERKAVERILRFKFTKTDAGYWHERCEDELAEYKKKGDVARENGKKGGRKPNPAKTNQEPSGLANGTGSQTNQEPITNNQKPETSSRSNPLSNASTAMPEPSDPIDLLGDTISPDDPPDHAGAAVQTPAEQVFEYWRTTMNHPQAKLDAKRKRAITARIKDGYTPERLMQAVDGCLYSPHHQGANDRGTVYDDIELICRDGPHVDSFVKIAQRGPPPQRNGMSENTRKTLDNIEKVLGRMENERQ